ncbi:type II toxin-antitoxin system RelE/ParE family toxin [Granulicella mallensis]|uniref:Uncharacterized protein n=1 Tax=Granulicella mallensis (strain ATCC BAA-1857 / DSM 23137 / MP5ACTX8) TaxID=682795 RepID=G8NX05_GRAMM|nr:type II toxin-antitoxin system RelE/ParE family toxin [Granulicella mallensis]AEU35533.1 hypothetical protein AciX8_1189 [Granulicella mallensis MP5ACTX8]
MKIIWTPRAASDLDGVVDFIQREARTLQPE